MKGCLSREHHGPFAAQKADADEIADGPLGTVSLVYGHLAGDPADGQLHGVLNEDEAQNGPLGAFVLMLG